MVQWYESNKQLFDEEVRYMTEVMPTATYGFLKNGNMYWNIVVQPIVAGERKNWMLLAVYDPDYPQGNRGGAIKFYPIKPSYDEMTEMVQDSPVTPKTIPHLMRDENYNIHISYVDSERTVIINAATALAHIMRWITVFELGMIDQKTWTLFHDHGKI